MFAVLNADLKICPCKICQGHISYNLDMNLFDGKDLDLSKDTIDTESRF